MWLERSLNPRHPSTTRQHHHMGLTVATPNNKVTCLGILLVIIKSLWADISFVLAFGHVTKNYALAVTCCAKSFHNYFYVSTEK